MRHWPQKLMMVLPALVLFSAALHAIQHKTASGVIDETQFDEDQPVRPAPTSADCTYLQNPEEFRVNPGRMRTLSEKTDTVARWIAPVFARTPEHGERTIERKNFIDDYIFGRMEAAGIQPAPLTSDSEFLRRVTLDLTGRIPSASDVIQFLDDTTPGKRDALIDRLIETPEFVDKWTMFLGDLYRVNANSTNVNRYVQGRDAFYRYIKDALAANKPYSEIVADLISATGDSFENGAANWIVGGTVPMGPAQDTYDGQAVNVAQMFLGINAVDCLLCHDGPRRLDGVNLWAQHETRADMWGLSAFFARTRMQRTVVQQTPLINKFTVVDQQAGDYLLNTTTGNRSPRQAVNGVNRVVARYPFNGETPGSGETPRQALARMVVSDIQFSRATVNYIWERFMTEAFVTPTNGFDLARLDLDNPPPEGWTLQATDPALLNAMAESFRQNGFNLRRLMETITKSAAYQLSSVYPGTWKPEYVPFYARHYARRLEAEEIHDAIAKATGIPGNYRMDSLPNIEWAMQLPDTREPRTNGGVAQFLNAFGRGDRDQTLRTSEGTVLQALNLMNNAFVMGRIHANNQGSTVSRLLAQTDDTLEIVRQLFLSTLARYPTQPELDSIWPMMLQLGNRRGVETLQWTLINKLDFIYNY